MQDLLPWLLLAALALALLGWWRASTRVRRGNASRQRMALRGESEAERLLERAGFRIVARQETGGWIIRVDGEPIEVRCRADLIVEGPGGTYVAEVKTGTRAPDPTCPATRRQLLEYLHAFPVDGALLVDMEAREVLEVEFAGVSPRGAAVNPRGPPGSSAAPTRAAPG